MDALHAPWRIDYILAPKPAEAPSGSVFTRILQADDDVANYVIARDKTCFALLNRYPYAGGHVLVLPYKEVPDLDDLTTGELTDLWELTRRCKRALSTVMRPDGFNIGINLGKVAGAGVGEHLHVHIVPRWNGDTNFMPVIGGTSVLPQAMAEVAANLREALANQPKSDA